MNVMADGRIVAHAITPHTPRMADPDSAPDFLAGVMAGSRELGEAIRADEPDLWVIHSAHWVTTFNWYVTHQSVHEGLCVGEECPDLIPGSNYKIQGDPGFSAALSQAIGESGLPSSRSETRNHRFDYGSYVPLVYLDPMFSVPVVLLGCCVMADLEECMMVGSAVAKAAEVSGRRVAFVASTALAHKLVEDRTAGRRRIIKRGTGLTSTCCVRARSVKPSVSFQTMPEPSRQRWAVEF